MGVHTFFCIKKLSSFRLDHVSSKGSNSTYRILLYLKSCFWMYCEMI